MHHPAAVDLDDSAILIANSTDPSCAALSFAADGVVADIGGLLRHGPIVAQANLGIPCVINMRSAMQQIRTGSSQSMVFPGNGRNLGTRPTPGRPLMSLRHSPCVSGLITANSDGTEPSHSLG
jgi:phosphoenolpyruvate-protein kinase (PTS system EI component)